MMTNEPSMEGGVKVRIELNISAAEMAMWEPERIASFFDGIAKMERAWQRNVEASPADPGDGAKGGE